MKAIILAAGKGTRLEPITLETPKAMVEVFGKSLLQYNMEKLLPYVDEFIIVVKYKKEIIIDFFGESFQGKKVSYHQQGEKKGTAGALEGLDISGDCFIIASDTIFSQSDIDTIAKKTGYGALCQKVKNPEKYGVFKTDSTGNILHVVEKPQEFISNLASLFYLKVNSDLITYCEQIEISPRGEYELTDALNIFFKNNTVQAIEISSPFTDITTVDDLHSANTIIKPHLGITQYLENIGTYELHLGIPKTGIQEIVSYSTDESDIALREGTSDWKKRFISEENLTAWYCDKDRYPFTLLSKDGAIAGLWWGRPAKLPNITEVLNQNLYNVVLENANSIHTSGIRIYPFARGERLASPFMQACERYYSSLFDSIYMSDDVGAENIPSQKAFERLGYEKVGYGKNINNSPESGKQRFVYVKKF